MRKMNKKPLVTVYITNYNYEKYIKKAIVSVLEQSFKDFEIIIIDDGSTDNSKNIIEGYSDHQKIKIIYQKNKGLIVTNNIALRLSQGKYIMRLDADDYLDSNALLVMVNRLEEDRNLGLVYPDYFVVDSMDNILKVRKRHSFEKEVDLPDNPAHGACTMVRVDFLKEIGGYDEEFSCQDGYHLWLNFISRYKVTNINTPLFYYRNHGNNLTSNEKRILDTRGAIKSKFFKNNVKEQKKALAIIPVRGPNYNINTVALRDLGDKKVIDWKIESALCAEMISKVIVTTPDPEITEYLKKNYSDIEKLHIHIRSPQLARFNIGLVDTIEKVFSDLGFIKNSDIFTILTINFPFITSKIIDTAIKTLQIFKSDTLISVRPDNNKFFQHSGGGMKAILNQDKFTKLERDELFRYSGGIIVTRKEFFEMNKEFMGGKIGHIIIDKFAAHFIQDSNDIAIAENIIEKMKQNESI